MWVDLAWSTFSKLGFKGKFSFINKYDKHTVLSPVTAPSWTFTDVKYCLFDGDEQGLPSFAVQNSRNSWKQFGCGPNHKWITSRSIRCLGRKDCIRISTWTTQVIWWWVRKKSPFPPKKRLFEKEYFCHLVMSKKKQEKSGNKQEKYDLLQTFYWYTITYGSG